MMKLLFQMLNHGGKNESKFSRHPTDPSSVCSPEVCFDSFKRLVSFALRHCCPIPPFCSMLLLWSSSVTAKAVRNALGRFRLLSGSFPSSATASPMVVGFTVGSYSGTRSECQHCVPTDFLSGTLISPLEKMLLSAGDHTVASLFVAVHSFCWNRPQGKFVCTNTLILSV